MIFAIRDDDTSFFTKPQELEAAYDFITEGCVSLSAVPFSVPYHKQSKPYGEGYEYSDKYIDIVTRWKQGDFSSADKDHNELAEIQGTKKDGMATGLSSKEQESNYIFRVFGIPVEKQN